MRYISILDINYSKYESRIKLEGGLVGGSRPRLVLMHKEKHEKYIFKSYSHTPREVISECLASHIADILDIQAQQVSIRRLDTKLVGQLKKISAKFPDDWIPVGTLARNIFPKNQEIKYGASIVETPNDKLRLEDIESSIRNKYYAPDDILDDFAEMIIFDAIIGNMDRHHENWGVVETHKFRQSMLLPIKEQIQQERHFTPLYDHGSSLLFELGDREIERYLSDMAIFEKSYVLGKKYSFLLDSIGNSLNIFDLVKMHINKKTIWGKRFKKSILKINNNFQYLAIAKKIAQMPNTDEILYTDSRRELILRSIILRIQILYDMVT